MEQNLHCCGNEEFKLFTILFDSLSSSFGSFQSLNVQSSIYYHPYSEKKMGLVHMNIINAPNIVNVADFFFYFLLLK